MDHFSGTEMSDREAVTSASFDPLLLALLDEAPVLMWANSPDGGTEFVNAACVRAWGQIAQMRPVPWPDLVHPDDVAPFRAIRDAALARGEAYEGEVRYRRASDGEWRWHLVRVRPVRDRDTGELVRWLGIATDIHDQVEAQKALRESERVARARAAWIEAVYAGAPVGLAFADRELRYLAVNDRLATFDGVTSNYYLGRTPAETALHFAQEVESYKRHVLATGVAIENIEISGTSPIRPGATSYLLTNLYPVHDETGAIIGVSTAALDITDRKAAEAALAASEARLRLALESAGLGTFDVDLSTNEAKWSPESFAIFGLKRRRDGIVSSADWRAMLHPDDLPACDAANKRLRAEGMRPQGMRTKGALYHVQYRIRRADTGAERWIESYGRLHDDDDSRPRLLGVQGDITERKLREQDLQDAARVLRLAHRLAGTGSFHWDLVSEKASVTPEWAVIFGLPPETSTYKVADKLRQLPPEDAAEHVRLIEEIIAGRSDGFEREFSVRRVNDGAVRRIDVRTEATRAADGRAVSLTGVVRDITEARCNERELRRLTEDLEARVREEVLAREAAQARAAQAERLQALGQLAGGIAHDFNNVLQAILGAAAMIERAPHNQDAVSRFARMALDAAERGASVTRRLLAFARRGTLHAEAIEPGSLLAGLRDILVHTLGAAIEIRVDAPAGLPPLLADRGQLETSLVNLATNARDAMPTGGTLRFAASVETVTPADAAAERHPGGLHPGRYLRLTVSDTGFGMDQETQDRVTEPFFTTKEPGQGTGLGLSMVKGFAEQSGGGLGIDSAPGSGTQVTLWLPSAEPAAARAATVASPAVKLGSKPRVLLVDDDDLVRETLAMHLAAFDFAVHAAPDGASALRDLDAGETPDILITDLSMPGLDGLSVIRAAQQRRPGLPAILLTGYAGETMEIAPGEPVALLRKPVSGTLLLRQIGSMLAGREDDAAVEQELVIRTTYV
jgi:PAS domain S-box-containing protein